MEGHDPWTCTCKECLEYCEQTMKAHYALYPDDAREEELRETEHAYRGDGQWDARY